PPPAPGPGRLLLLPVGPLQRGCDRRVEACRLPRRDHDPAGPRQADRPLPTEPHPGQRHRWTDDAGREDQGSGRLIRSAVDPACLSSMCCLWVKKLPSEPASAATTEIAQSSKKMSRIRPPVESGFFSCDETVNS